MKSGIYQILNLINQKSYIGSAINIKQRWAVHKSLLKNNKHINKYLQNAWNKYGEDNFKFIVIDYFEIKDLIDMENYYFEQFKPEYNGTLIAGSSLGKKASEETKKKMSIIRKGRKHTQETRQKISIAALGNTRTLGKTFNRVSQRSLPNEYIREIRASKLNANRLSKEYGCHPSVIRNIKNCITYKDIK